MSHTADHRADPSGPSSSAGTASTAKDQAAQVGHDAAGSAQHVAGVASEQASRVASEASDRARDLFAQGRDELRGQASAGQQRAAGGLQSLAQELRGMADGQSGGGGLAGHLAAQASEHVSRAGDWLQSREPADVVSEVSEFARRRPGAFLAIAAGAGLVAGRLTRGLGAAARDDRGGAAGRPAPDASAAAPGPAHRAEAPEDLAGPADPAARGTEAVDDDLTRAAAARESGAR